MERNNIVSIKAHKEKQDSWLLAKKCFWYLMKILKMPGWLAGYLQTFSWNERWRIIITKKKNYMLILDNSEQV